MEIEIVLLSVLGSLLLAYLLHVLHKRRDLKKHMGNLIFTSLLIISLILFPVTFLSEDGMVYF